MPALRVSLNYNKHVIIAIEEILLKETAQSLQAIFSILSMMTPFAFSVQKAKTKNKRLIEYILKMFAKASFIELVFDLNWALQTD